MEAWSISTAVREPERVPSFLSEITALEGKPWDSGSQAEYFYRLISGRLYRPEELLDEHYEILDDPERTISRELVVEIVKFKEYKDGPEMRGRQAIQPLIKMGLVLVEPTISLSEIGKGLLAGAITLQEAMLNWALKWETPIPGDKKFKASKGYNIKPFIGTLALISKVNELAKSNGMNAVGISRNEFDLFCPTLIDWQDIDKFAQRIISYRKAGRGLDSARAKLASQRAAITEHLTDIARGERVTDTSLATLSDYGDNAIRYFRTTAFIEFRGAGRYVDIAVAAREQVKQLIENELYKPQLFADKEAYLANLSDLSASAPPWNTAENLERVKSTLRAVLVDELQVSVDAPQGAAAPVTAASVTGEDSEIKNLKAKIKAARLAQMKQQSRDSVFIAGFIDEYASLPKNNYAGYLPKPVALEFNAYKTFLSLNDALAVTPNYPTGDDGEPVSTASGNKTDMLVEYNDFLLSVEVTMEGTRNQWAMEGQPVQRHLRKIEDDGTKTAFALFLAPRLHPDTLETFWHANKSGYQGTVQKIVPLPFEVWIKYLEKVKPLLLDGTYNSGHVRKLLNSGLPRESHNSSLDWIDYLKSNTYLESAVPEN
jgi:hypothetical protein